jgi:hypothetical protein
MWAVMRALPRSAGDVMTHGDLIPGNVLVAHGHLAGVIDVGGLGPADPALDLVGAWHLLEAGPRQALRDDFGCDDLEWERGKAWAFEQSMGAAWYYVESNPAMSLMGNALCNPSLRTLSGPVPESDRSVEGGVAVPPACHIRGRCLRVRGCPASSTAVRVVRLPRWLPATRWLSGGDVGHAVSQFAGAQPAGSPMDHVVTVSADEDQIIKGVVRRPVTCSGTAVRLRPHPAWVPDLLQRRPRPPLDRVLRVDLEECLLHVVVGLGESSHTKGFAKRSWPRCRQPRGVWDLAAWTTSRMA